jgi:hypothetical protein
MRSPREIESVFTKYNVSFTWQLLAAIQSYPGKRERRAPTHIIGDLRVSRTPPHDVKQRTKLEYSSLATSSHAAQLRPSIRILKIYKIHKF